MIVHGIMHTEYLPATAYDPEGLDIMGAVAHALFWSTAFWALVYCGYILVTL